MDDLPEEEKKLPRRTFLKWMGLGIAYLGGVPFAIKNLPDRFKRGEMDKEISKFLSEFYPGKDDLRWSVESLGRHTAFLGSCERVKCIKHMGKNVVIVGIPYSEDRVDRALAILRELRNKGVIDGDRVVCDYYFRELSKHHDGEVTVFNPKNNPIHHFEFFQRKGSMKLAKVLGIAFIYVPFHKLLDRADVMPVVKNLLKIITGMFAYSASSRLGLSAFSAATRGKELLAYEATIHALRRARKGVPVVTFPVHVEGIERLFKDKNYLHSVRLEWTPFKYKYSAIGSTLSRVRDKKFMK